MTVPIAPGFPVFRQGGDLRDTIELRDADNVVIDLSTLSDLEYRLSLVGTATTVTRKKSVSADRSFPGGGTGSDGRITFIVLQAAFDALTPGQYDLEVTSVPAGGQRVVEAKDTVTIEAALT